MRSTEHYFVTGGASGVGMAFAELAVASGARCTVLDVVGRASTDRSSGAVTWVEGDVRERKDVETALHLGLREGGRFSGFFNNAGMLGQRSSIHEVTLSEWKSVMDVNLTGVWHCMAAQMAYCLSERPCPIVNNASISGLHGSLWYPVYAAAKHGVVGLTRSAALSFGLHGVRVNAIASSVVETEMTQRERAQYGGDVETDSRCNPLSRTAQPTDLARAAMWLLSTQATHINGHVMVLDGGQYA